MCCFTGPPLAIKRVWKTNIFARADGDQQILVYSMNVTGNEPVAMILPLPVPPRSAEDSVRFINLEGYRRFFVDLNSGFPEITVGPPLSLGAPAAAASSSAPPRLEVHRVGKFEASFVPTLADFERLDPRFRIGDEVWQALPQYQDWGFAVFKLIDLGRGWFWKKRTIHPMAFSFPRRDDSRRTKNTLFFPTVHVHDGAVHAAAQFDHQLYSQAPTFLSASRYWGFHQLSAEPAQTFMDVERANGLVNAELPVSRMSIFGTRTNEDVWLGR
jgi:hypothetical protein